MHFCRFGEVAVSINCLDGDRESIQTFVRFIESSDSGYFLFKFKITSTVVVRAIYAAASGIGYLIVRLND